MSWLSVSDPLALVAIQSGKITTPRRERAAVGSSQLDVNQRSVEIGEPIPIVFGVRRNNHGGVLVSPGATEARFEQLVGRIKAYYHLVISEGLIDSIPVKDVFQRSCRVGAHTQTYNRRAGTWIPGNFIPAQVNIEASFFTGSIGTYPDMSTLSFEVALPQSSDQWKRQVHLFIRGGMHVQRLIDNTFGPSDNFADLVKWMLQNSRRVPEQLIDNDALFSAALFLEANGFYCNTLIRESTNYYDFIAAWAPYFLLAESNVRGKRGLRPVLPTNSNGTLILTAISWSYIFTENEIIPGTFELQYANYSDRLPFVALMTWRQQPDDDIGIIRTAEVRVGNTAETGPYESHDMSQYCTTENHAVKVGAYTLAKRLYTTHMVRFTARPEAHNKLLTPGDIIRVKLDRITPETNPSTHDYLYQIERISQGVAGGVTYECSHFPIDSEGRSIISLAVANAVGTGFLIENVRSGVSCDAPPTGGGGGGGGSRQEDETIPEEEGITPGGASDPQFPPSWPVDAGGDPIPWPVDENNEPIPWPIDGNGNPRPWPTDDNGNPLPYDIEDPTFLPWENFPIGNDGLPVFPIGNDGLPLIPINTGGVPTIPIGGDGLPSFDSTVPAIDGGGGISIPPIGDFPPAGDSPSAGPSDSSENPQDGTDPQPLGPMQSCPVPGGSNGVPPAGFCAGGTIIRIMGNIGDEGNAIRETVTSYGIPLVPPDELGGDDWNNKFVLFEFECPDGSRQTTDPCNNPQPPGDQAFGYSQPVNVTVNIVWSYQLNSTPCNLINPPSSENDSGIASIALSSVVKLYMATTGEPGSGLVLPATGGPAPPHAPSGAECGSSGSYRRNAFLLSEDNTGSITQTAVYGSNQSLFADSSYTGSHTSRITSIILNESVEGIGDAGDDITELGLASNTPYPIS